MKKAKLNLTVVSMLLLCVTAFNLTSCVANIQSDNMMDSITSNEVNAITDLKSSSSDISDFAVRLFQASNQDGKNTLVSPLSVLCALAMTANGANGETLEQMEAVLGMNVQELNLFLYSYMNYLPQGEKYKLSLANSIWFKDDGKFTVNRNFLQTNADYYGADIYKAPFDSQTLKDINNWVKKETNDMISKVLEEIPPLALMYLINALAFEAEWSSIYNKNQVHNRIFTKEDGTKQNAELMYSEESKYLADDKATGFIKYYSGGKYAFVALLPNQDVSLSEYIASLNGESLITLLSNVQNTTVETAIPKFETEYNSEMSAILKGMGMPDAFDKNAANFSDLGTYEGGNIFISRVIHKTCIQVGEKGTKAGAVTVVEMTPESALPAPSKQVYLDRPFLYMLIDCENNIPFFIGSMTDIQE